MLLLELASQGLQAAAFPSGSVRLRPGYDVVAAEGASIRRLLEALIRPAPGDGLALRAGPAGARAGLTFLGDDGLTYRLLRDFSAGMQLQRFDPRRRAFVLEQQSAGEDQAALASRAGFPDRDALRRVSLSAADLPSRRGAPLRTSSVLVPPRRGPTEGEVSARRAELRAELERARAAEELQERVNALQAQLFKAEEALREEVRLREVAGSAQAALEAAAEEARVEGRLGDVEAKLAAHARARARLDEVLARCGAEAESLDGAEASGPPAGFWRESRFWSGIALAAAAVVAALAGSGSVPGLRYLALLDVPALGWSALSALGWVSSSEAYGRLGRRRQLVKDHERKAREAFQREGAEVQAAVAALKLAGAAELRERLAQLTGWRAAASRANEALEAFLVQPEVRAAQEERARLEGEVRRLEVRLAGAVGGWTRESRTVEAELVRLAAPPAGEAPPMESPEPAVAAPAQGVEAATVEAGPGPRTLEPLAACLEEAARALGGSAAAAGREVQPRASQLVQAFTGGRLSGLAVDDRGNLLVLASGRPTPAAGASPPDRDFVFIALKLAFIERLLPGRFALLDGALDTLPDAARPAAAAALKQMARPGQIVHATLDAAFRAAADHLA